MRSFLRRVYFWIDKSNLWGSQRLIEKLFSRRAHSYSFYGEDLLIRAIVNRIKYETGIELQLNYVDIGAWRPIRGSNTYSSYKLGSRGTVVEPNIAFRKHWRVLRPEDQFLQFACGKMSEAQFFLFQSGSPANTLDSNFAAKIGEKESRVLTESYMVKVMTLEDILEAHLNRFPGDYFLDIDVEGLDFEVITSFDFKSMLRPIILVVEDTEPMILQSQIHEHLVKLNYGLVARTPISSCYLDFTRNEITGLNEISRI